MVELRNNFENLVLHDSHGVHLKIIEGPRSTGCHFAPCHFKPIRSFDLSELIKVKLVHFKGIGPT